MNSRHQKTLHGTNIINYDGIYKLNRNTFTIRLETHYKRDTIAISDEEPEAFRLSTDLKRFSLTTPKTTYYFNYYLINN